MQSAAALAQQYDLDDAEEQELQEKEVVKTVNVPEKNQVREYHLEITDPPRAYGPAATSNYEYARQDKQRSLFRCISSDVLHHFLFYFFCFALCALAVFRITQVQETRQMTTDLNEIAETNDDLANEWLGLLAKKESLEKQSLIRDAAVTQLGMFQPKTEAEVVVVLDR